jgi:hypothetical protein
MRWALLGWLMIALVGGCKKQKGEACASSEDCLNDLACAGWTQHHEAVVGKCAASKCCVAQAQQEEVSVARQKAGKLKTEECPRLQAVINRELATVKGFNGTSAEDLSILAGKLDAVAENVGKTEYDDQRVKEYRDKYTSIAREIGTTARAAAAAMSSTDVEATARSAKKMKALTTREDALISALNNYCGSAK